MIFQQTIQTFSQSPRKLFAIDGFGALLSAFLLGIVLVKLESTFGIPRSALYVLAFIPCLFAVYDGYCYWNVKNNISPFLKGIAIANVLYCLLSIGFAIYHHQSLTVLGWAYILVEIVIVLLLANIEMKVADGKFTKHG